MQEWVGKRCKVFIRNLIAEKAIVYTGVVLSVTSTFITIKDRTDNTVSINVQDIVQIKGEE